MNLLDFVILWVESLRELFLSKGISVRIMRTDDDRQNHSCSITLENDYVEIDFIVWESGDGELAFTYTQKEGSTEEHLSNLDRQDTLITVLSRVIKELLRN